MHGLMFPSFFLIRGIGSVNRQADNIISLIVHFFMKKGLGEKQKTNNCGKYENDDFPRRYRHKNCFIKIGKPSMGSKLFLKGVCSYICLSMDAKSSKKLLSLCNDCVRSRCIYSKAIRSTLRFSSCLME